MKKKLLSFVTLIFVSVLFMSNIFVVNAAGKYGTVKDISNEDSVWNKDESGYKVEITGNTTADVVVKYGEVKVNTLPGKDTRPDGYAWLGFNITNAGTGTTKVKVNGNPTNDYSDGDYYFAINKDMLISAAKKGTNIEYNYEFDWENNGDYEQRVKVIIDPSKVTLTEGSSTGIALWKPDMVAQYAPLDNQPNTGDTLSFTLIGLLSVILCTGVYSFKLAKK